MKNDKQLKVRFLGGVGEIGKNMTALEYGKVLSSSTRGRLSPQMICRGSTSLFRISVI